MKEESNTVIVGGYSNLPITNQSVSYVKKKYKIPNGVVVIPKFEKEFNCKVTKLEEKESPFDVKYEIRFQSEEEKVMFLLKFA